jgi:hypothetical protein
VFAHDWLLTLDYFVDAIVGRVGSFDIAKNGNRTIGSTSTRVVSVSRLTKEKRNIQRLGLRIPDSIMESDSQGGVSLFTAFAVVEEIGLNVL